MATKGKSIGLSDAESKLADDMRIQVTLPNGQPYQFSLHDATWIDLENLSGEVQGQAQRYAFYAMIHVGVKDEARKVRSQMAAFIVAHSPAVRERLGKGATETAIKQEVQGQEGYRTLETRAEQLESLETRVGVVREALTHRRDMLQSACMIRGPERSASAGERAERSYTPRRNGG